MAIRVWFETLMVERNIAQRTRSRGHHLTVFVQRVMDTAKRAFEGDEESEMNAYTPETKVMAKRARTPQ